MLQLNELTSLSKKRKRVGRGGSRGGTSGKGHKGQKARSGKRISPGFEGGQMPLYRRLPKRGFGNTRFAPDVYMVNIDRLEAACTDGQEVTKEFLLENNLVKAASSKGPFLIKILGNGSLSKKLVVHADLASKSAAKAIEEAGGEVRLTKEI